MECLNTKTCDVVSIYNMWSSIQVHSIREFEIHNNLTACCVRSFQDWLWSISMTFGWKGAQRQAVWSIYTDLQSFLGTFPIQKVSILAVEDYSFEDELKLVEMRILAYSDSSPDKMCIFWTHFCLFLRPSSVKWVCINLVSRNSAKLCTSTWHMSVYKFENLGAITTITQEAWTSFGRRTSRSRGPS
jgi:hypothetical protein